MTRLPQVAGRPEPEHGEARTKAQTAAHRRATFSRARHGARGRLGVVGGVATDRAGHLYVLDSENERVQVFVR